VTGKCNGNILFSAGEELKIFYTHCIILPKETYFHIKYYLIYNF